MTCVRCVALLVDNNSRIPHLMQGNFLHFKLCLFHAIRSETMDTQLGNTVKLNVGGMIFQCYRETLQTFPDSKLAKLDLSQTNHDCPMEEYFFDRNPLLFVAILDAYRKGSVHIPKTACGTTFKAELEFWELSLEHVSPCCWETLYGSDDDIENMNNLVKKIQSASNGPLLLEGERTLRQKIWLLLDEPGSSKMAFVWGMFISTVILTSLMLLALQSVFLDTYSDEEFDFLSKTEELLNMNTTVLKTSKPNESLVFISAGTHIVLTIELLFYFIICPSKQKFVSCILRMGTLVGYLCFWVAFAMERNFQNMSSAYALPAYVIVKYMSMLEVLRLFYITRHVPAFKLIAMTFCKSKEELRIVGFLLSIMVCLFGFVMYVAELTHNTKINNVFNSMYWALITLTTVGYGDYTPVTSFGHVVAAICSVCGVLVLALPVGVIVSTFYALYNNHKYAAKHVQLYGKSMRADTHVNVL